MNCGIKIRESMLKVGGRPFLSCPDLELDSGKIHCIRGRSGSGKSSFLRAISGFSEASGLDYSYVTPASIDSTAVAGHTHILLQQSVMLWPHLSAFQNCWMPWSVQLGIAGFWQRRKQARGRAEHWLEKLQISNETRHRRMGQLSGGEQQRIALAACLVFETDFVLLDEPTSNLDYLSTRIIVEILNELAAIGKTVIITTHDDDLLQQQSWSHLQILDDEIGADSPGLNLLSIL